MAKSIYKRPAKQFFPYCPNDKVFYVICVIIKSYTFRRQRKRVSRDPETQSNCFVEETECLCNFFCSKNVSSLQHYVALDSLFFFEGVSVSLSFIYILYIGFRWCQQANYKVVNSTIVLCASACVIMCPVVECSKCYQMIANANNRRGNASANKHQTRRG